MYQEVGLERVAWRMRAADEASGSSNTVRRGVGVESRVCLVLN